jgi:hypothetical protein
MSAITLNVTPTARDIKSEGTDIGTSMSFSNAIRYIQNNKSKQVNIIRLGDGDYFLNEIVLPRNTYLIGTGRSRVRLHTSNITFTGGRSGLRRLTWMTEKTSKNPISVSKDGTVTLRRITINTQVPHLVFPSGNFVLDSVRLNVTSDGSRSSVINFATNGIVNVSNSVFSIQVTRAINKYLAILANYGKGSTSIINSQISLFLVGGSGPFVIFDGINNVRNISLKLTGSGSETVLLVGSGPTTIRPHKMSVSEVKIQSSNILDIYTTPDGTDQVSVNSVMGVPLRKYPHRINEGTPGGMMEVLNEGVTGPRGEDQGMVSNLLVTGVTGIQQSPIVKRIGEFVSQLFGTGNPTSNRNFVKSVGNGLNFEQKDSLNSMEGMSNFLPLQQTGVTGVNGMSPFLPRQQIGVTGVNGNGKVKVMGKGPNGIFYVVRDQDKVLICNAIQGSIDIILPRDLENGKTLYFEREDQSNNRVSIQAEHGHIDGHERAFLHGCSCHQKLRLKKHGTDWNIE